MAMDPYELTILEDLGAMDAAKMGTDALTWLQQDVLTWASLIQLGVVAVLFVLALWIWRKARPSYRKLFEPFLEGAPGLTILVRAVEDILWPLGLAFSLHIAKGVAQTVDWPYHILGIFTALSYAWAIIRASSALITNRFWSRFVAFGVFAVVVLDSFSLLDDVTDALSRLGGEYNGTYISALTVIKALIWFVVFLQVAGLLSRFFDHRVDKVDDLSPSARVLFSKVFKMGLYGLAFFLAVSLTGVSLTSFAVFSGAMGVGIGFGLQKVFSNLVSGLILLMDKSIKPGDNIQIDEVYGKITALNARFVSVVTRDGKGYLIPNEEWITTRVINWSWGDSHIRLHIPVGIAYESDPHLAKQIMEEAALKVKRVLRHPAPAARLVAFGDSSVDFQLRVWIRDAERGVTNVKSEVLFHIWDAFQEHDIDLPFPQRDVYIKSVPGGILSAPHYDEGSDKPDKPGNSNKEDAK